MLCMLRWGKSPLGHRAQDGDSMGTAGGSGGIGGGGGWGVGGNRCCVSRPYAGAYDEPRVVEVAGAACLGRVAEP